MTDTGFSVPDSAMGRFPPLYEATPRGMALYEAPEISAWRQAKVDTFCGGGGLVGTIDDYWRFAEMLRGGGELGGERISALAPCNWRRAITCLAILLHWQPMSGPRPSLTVSDSDCLVPWCSIRRRHRFLHRSATMAGEVRQALSFGSALLTTWWSFSSRNCCLRAPFRCARNFAPSSMLH